MTLSTANRWVWRAVAALSLLLFAFVGCLCAQAARVNRDDVERAMQHELFANRERISDIWRPSKRLLSDQARAEKCYIRFHLGKTDDCSEQLDRVRVDLQQEAK